MQQPTLNSQSPWGQIDTLTEIAPGVLFVSTPSHGGFWLSSERLEEIRARFPELLAPSRFYVPDLPRAHWFEEDCEATRVFLGLPTLFKMEQVRGAVSVAHSMAMLDGYPHWSTISARLSDMDAGQIYPCCGPSLSERNEHETLGLMHGDFDATRNALGLGGGS